MKLPLLLNAVCYDSVMLNNGQTTYSFFDDTDDELGPRVTKLQETSVINWIFNHPYNLTESLFFHELGISKSYVPFFEVREPIIKDGEAPGDIDILLIDKQTPQHSIAFQVKKIKSVIDENNETMLKTSEIIRGIHQTKWMFNKYHFHQNYFMVLLVTDSQNRKNKSQLFRYNTVDEKRIVYDNSGFEELPEGVGIYVFEINQPSINDINHTAIAAAKVLRPAKRIDQSEDTTDRICRLLNSTRKSLNNNTSAI